MAKVLTSALGNRWLLFASWIALSCLLFKIPLTAFIRMSLSNDDTSYLVLIPFMSGWVLYVERRKIFLNLSHDKVLAGILLLLAITAALASRLAGGISVQGLDVSIIILSLLLAWVAGFALLFGRVALTTGYFPLLFLLLMVPLPNLFLDRVIYLLQEGSAWTTGALFDLAGVPALRDGLVFHLARINIEVAKECSGIRSSMALLILALLVAHFYITSFWKKVLFLCCGLLMMVLKNGIRISTLTLLAIYVDPGFLHGKLHHQGGVIFFLFSLLLLAPLLWLLQRGEAIPKHDLPLPVLPSESDLPSA
ncbi:MAG TPA: exosortase/archaeosortase family protein [Candidatus Acidoferrum sp.]|nr:exosortase/archaeosortase family protein [Candidatus Acidoferrum sp.]